MTDGDSLSIEKIVAMLLYMGILLFLGAIASRRMKDVREYFAGGKRLGFLSVAFSARATGESGWLLLGLTGMGAAVGFQAFWVVIGEVLGVGLAWLFMSRRFKHLADRYDAITVPDYLEARFRDPSHSLRLIAAGTLVVNIIIYVSAQIDATGQAFETLLGFKSLFSFMGEDAGYFIGALIGFAIVLVYITSGGFVAVVWSDIFQGMLMLLGLVALPLVGFAAIGGLDPMFETLKASHPEVLHWNGGKPLSIVSVATIVGLTAIGLGFLGSPQVFVRFIALKSKREINKGAAVAILWTILADSGAVLTGIVGRALFEGADLGENSQNVLPMLVNAYLPAILSGLFIAVVLSAIMSTIDSLLVVAGSAAVRDYYQKTLHPDLSDESLVRASRWTTFFVACFALVIACCVALFTEQRSIFWFIIFGWAGIAATFCPTIILSLFWSGITALGAKVAMVTGFLCVPLFEFGIPALFEEGGTANTAVVEADSLAPAFFASGVTAVVVSLLDRKGREKVRGFKEDVTDYRSA